MRDRRAANADCFSGAAPSFVARDGTTAATGDLASGCGKFPVSFRGAIEEAGFRPVSRAISKRVSGTVPGKRQLRVCSVCLPPGTGREGCGARFRNALPSGCGFRASRQWIYCAGGSVGRSRHRQAERPEFAQAFLQNEGLAVEHRYQDLRRPLTNAKPCRARRRKTRVAWAAENGMLDRYAGRLQDAPRGVVSGTLDHPFGVSQPMFAAPERKDRESWTGMSGLMDRRTSEGALPGTGIVE